jgi:hypothetical protein
MEQKENKTQPAFILDIFNLRKPIPFKESNLLFYDNRGLITFPPEKHRCEHYNHLNKHETHNINEMYVQKWDYDIEIIHDIVTSKEMVIPSPIIICKECYEYEIKKQYNR